MNDKELYSVLADDKTIEITAEALRKNGIEVFVVSDALEAKNKVMEILPKGAEVMTMTSVTLDSTGIAKHINTSGDYNSVREKLQSLDRKTQGDEMQKMGAAPEWAIGSVHAVTEDGKIMIASATGSQLPAYAYGSQHVLWVVGAHKIVKDTVDAMKRIYEYVYPLENERALKAYGVGSGVNKLLTISKEVTQGRIHMVIVKEKLGF